MKTILKVVLYGVLVVLLLVSCVGGSSSSTAKTDGMTDEIESIIADYQAADEKIQQELEKLGKAENPDLTKVTKLAEKKQQLDKDSEAKMEAAAKKLVGKEMPYELSEGLFYSIASPLTITKADAVGVSAVAYISYRIKINKPLRIAKGEIPSVCNVYYKFVDTKGNVLTTSLGNPFGLSMTREVIELEAGQVLDKELSMSFNIEKNSGVCKIVFISEEEYRALGGFK